MRAHHELALALPVASPDQEPAQPLASFRETRQSSIKADDQCAFADAPQKKRGLQRRLVHDAATCHHQSNSVPLFLAPVLPLELTLIRRAEKKSDAAECPSCELPHCVTRAALDNVQPGLSESPRMHERRKMCTDEQ